jgi:hypothetical protein
MVEPHDRAEHVLPPGYHGPIRVLLDPDMAAEWTGRPRSTLRRWVKEGRLTRYGPPGQSLYDIDELPERTVGGVPPLLPNREQP